MIDFGITQKNVHDIAIEKGWWSKPRTFGDVIALIHSEASEALEEYREGQPIGRLYFDENGKPCGIPVELADIVIRVMDFAEHNMIDLEQAILAKIEYNRTRPNRHGGKVL